MFNDSNCNFNATYAQKNTTFLNASNFSEEVQNLTEDILILPAFYNPLMTENWFVYKKIFEYKKIS